MERCILKLNHPLPLGVTVNLTRLSVSVPVVHDTPSVVKLPLLFLRSTRYVYALSSPLIVSLKPDTSASFFDMLNTPEELERYVTDGVALLTAVIYELFNSYSGFKAGSFCCKRKIKSILSGAVELVIFRSINSVSDVGGIFSNLTLYPSASASSSVKLESPITTPCISVTLKL